jgi:hypothetical protein
MTHEEKQLKDQYGITYKEKMVFYFQGHKCERLDDAVNYAKKLGEACR